MSVFSDIIISLTNLAKVLQIPPLIMWCGSKCHKCFVHVLFLYMCLCFGHVSTPSSQWCVSWLYPGVQSSCLDQFLLLKFLCLVVKSCTFLMSLSFFVFPASMFLVMLSCACILVHDHGSSWSCLPGITSTLVGFPQINNMPIWLTCILLHLHTLQCASYANLILAISVAHRNKLS